ncbi:uncharacterized protein LOC114124439 [Aphis gossypii]|uniref:uncharacterized protein LOC114124439 n=1 Tax=Aphis gossypii TaxID=80765 RepID=UPI002158E24F|nr:uncharacterized protein LOC114124439 [Aphis gossypii]
MDKECPHCHALKFKNEPVGMCCASGKMQLPKVETPPEPLNGLLIGTDPDSNVFLKSIRTFNSCFQITLKKIFAFAMTINKSQGQTMSVCDLDLSTPCFSHGQLYVACSRVGKPSSLFVLAKDGLTKNIVHAIALRN